MDTPKRHLGWPWLRRTESREALEDALMHLHQGEHGGRPGSTESLAGALALSTRAALSLVRRMEAQGLLSASAEGLRLSADGRRYALHVVRAHRLYERYLADETTVPKEEIHERAHRLQHALSPEQIEKLDADMGHPTHDPHGDPIPTLAGDLPPAEAYSLADWPTDRPALITHVEDEPPQVYAQIVAEGLAPGMGVTVLVSTPRRLVVEADAGECVLAPVVAANISVRDADAVPRPRPAVRLSALGVGGRGRVLALDDGCQGLTRRRFLDLGLTPGVEVQAVMRSAFGEPTAYRVRDTLVALRREQADLVLIEARG